ncbi:sensor histidine kinase [Parasphingorhabdus sp. DH2-15]|uniref:sensor histidine kinase n=1 Tax=Parasphingorhabdus sp. DH2-15 TaxID=3444112 RepID=UPI003F682519
MAADNFYWTDENKPRAYSTGLKLFLILLLAMAPLALIAFLVTIQIDRNSKDTRNDVAVSSLNLSALRLNNALSLVQEKLLETTQPRINGDESAACKQLSALAREDSVDSALLIKGTSGEPICTIGVMPENITRQIMIGTPDPLQIANNQSGLILHIREPDQRLAASVFISAATLLRLADPQDDLPLSHMRLHSGNEDLLLKQLPIRDKNRLEGGIIATQAVLGMELVLQLPKPPTVSPNYFIRILLVMMTVFAAMIGWVIVNRMLLGPLNALQKKMHDYSPGAPVSELKLSGTIAPEIRELDTVFNHLAGKVNDDKTVLADSLEDQIKLTREVHHRVKNNLQIITSLLNLHGRSIADPELKEQYSMIQRRVDALAVVHRNHFAQGEAAKGIALRALINEIVASFRKGGRNDIAARTHIRCEQHKVEQDTAMPVAFLLTELLEVIETLDRDAPNRLTISAEADSTGKLLRLKLSSESLIGDQAIAMLGQHNISKVITGLSRQLRTDLVHNHKTGAIAMAIPVIAHSQSEPDEPA